MERSLQIHKLVPVLIEPDQIGLDIEAELTETDEGVDFAVTDVTFEVRVGVRKVYEKKSDAQTGQFVANNIEVGEVEPQFEVTVSATDQNGKLSVKMQKDASTLLKGIRDRQEAKGKHVNSKTKPRDVNPPNDQADTEPELSPDQIAELAERERQIKVVITKALARLLNKRYCTNTTGQIWDSRSEEYINTKIHFELEKDWVQSEKNEKYVPNSWDDIPNSKDIARSDILVLKVNQNHPLVKRKIIETARELPITFIDNLDCFYETGWAEEVISELAKINPQAILEKLIEFYKYNWAKNVVSKIADSNPTLVFNLIELFEYHPWAGEVAMIAAAHDPKSAIENYDKYRDRPWAEEVLEFANTRSEEMILEEAERKLHAERAQREEMERNKTAQIETAIGVFSENSIAGEARDALRTFLYYQGDERVEKAVAELVKLHPEIFFANHNLYVEASWGEKVTKLLVEYYPPARYSLLLQRYYGHEIDVANLHGAISYKDSSQEAYFRFREKLDKLSSSKNFDEWQKLYDSCEREETENSFQIGSDIHNYLIKLFSTYKIHKNGREIVEEIVKNLPRLAVMQFEVFESEPWAIDILKIAAPLLGRAIGDLTVLRKILAVYGRYEKEHWSSEVLAGARDNINIIEINSERGEWLKKAEQHRLNTAKDVLANHINKPWAEEVLKKTCENDEQVCKIVFTNLDKYAEKPWAKSFYFDLIRKNPVLALSNWPQNSYGWEIEMIDVIVRILSKDYLVDFCSRSPISTPALLLIDMLKDTDTRFKVLFWKKAIWRIFS